MTPNLNNAGTETWKILNKIVSRGFNPSKVFSDWLELCLCAFDTRREDHYLRIISHYLDDRKEGDRNADYFAYALASLLEKTRDCNHDVLGNIYEMFICNGQNGQFFTPWGVSDLMSLLTNIEDSTGLISDPCCGSGRCLISAAKINSQLKFHGRDIDYICSMMAALNLMFFNLNGVIEHGNTFTFAIQNAWVTKRSIIYGGSLRWLNKDELEDYKRNEMVQEKVSAPIRVKEKQESYQMELF